ncbi:MAG TPA: TolC family protein [Aquabacterium sp.]|nr:TolC family protein [Aquabacterium sp.]
MRLTGQQYVIGSILLALACVSPADAARRVHKVKPHARAVPQRVVPYVKPQPRLVAPAMPATQALPQTAARSSGPSTRCRSELSPDSLDRVASGAKDESQLPAVSGDPQTQLKQIAQLAIQRSNAVGASQWLRDAANLDFDETDAGRYPTVNLIGSSLGGRTSAGGITTSHGLVNSLGVSATAPLYDGGRLKSLIQWRKDLRSAAGQSLNAAKEAVVLEAVTTVLERNRYKTQAQVYQQHARKMACLVEALEAIVAEDHGRASELVQVRKTQEQAELSRDSAVAQSRQIEIKLKRLLGDQFTGGDGINGALLNVPELGELHRMLEQTPEAIQLKLQSQAQEDYAKALDDGRGPQFNWMVNRTQTYAKPLNGSEWQAGITMSYNIFDAHAQKSAVQAALARAEAARSQYADFIATRTERISSVHDGAETAFDRAKRYVDILRDSDLLRNYTFQQWSQLGKRSLFDLMSAESDHFSLRIAYVNSLFDGYEANAQLRSMGGGLTPWVLGDADR